jgi:type I restriction enzyme S subunit
MRTYDKYKASGIEWIGEIPEHWGCQKLRRSSQVKRGASPRPIDDLKYFDDNGKYSWVRIADVTASEKYLTQTKEKLSELGASLSVKRHPGDLILSIAATVGKPIIVKINCCIHDGFVYFPQLKINTEFLFYIFYTGQAYFGLGKWGTQLNLNSETISEIFIPIPTNDEQTAIANYLDEKTAEIDQTIADKEELIKLYEEEKKALINEAVTKGINPNVKLKPSSIDWLGDIPEHWEVKKLFYLFNKISSGTTPKSDDVSYYENGTINWLNTGDLNNTYITETSKKITQKAFDEHSALKVYPKGSIVIAMYGATIGKLGILEIETTTNQACCVLSDIKNVSTLFVFYCLISGQDAILNLSYGGGQPNISQDTLRSFKIPFPPIKEQTQIVEFIEWESNLINEKINTTQQEMALLKEYRQALIFEAVTGKICVL